MIEPITPDNKKLLYKLPDNVTNIINNQIINNWDSYMARIYVDILFQELSNETHMPIDMCKREWLHRIPLVYEQYGWNVLLKNEAPGRQYLKFRRKSQVQENNHDQR